MTSKESNDPILGFNTKNIKNDILRFKDEALKDFKDAQKKVYDKYQNLDLEIKEKLESYENRITTYENKIMELKNLINTDKTIRDKVENLIEFKERAEDKMLTEKIRLDNFRNDLNSNVDRIDQILKDSVIYPGVVGGISKYKTFHDLIDYVLTQCSLNLTFREKSILDFKGYKTKLENSISAFNTQINTLLNTTSEYTKTCVKELEKNIKSIFNVYDDRLQDTRIENANYAVGLERATDALKKELENLYIIKKELYEKVDSGIEEIKDDNTRVVKLFTGYKKNFHLIQHKFNQLSDFIKDIRFRINLKEDVNRREYSHMSDLINFDKKKKGFYDGVYDINIIKKGLGSQLKDYIEGKITADQLFRKRTDFSKSMGKLNENTPLNNNINNDLKKRISISPGSKSGAKYGEEVKLNFVDLLKSTLSKRMSLDSEDFKNSLFINTKKEVIKEEDDENNNNSKELSSIFNKTVKEKTINQDLFEKELDRKKEDITFDKKQDKPKKPKKEESKIQIVSKDINKEKEKNEKEKNEDDKNDKEKNLRKPRTSMKDVLNDLFSVKDIMKNIRSQSNENSSNIKIINQNGKNRKSSLEINDNSANNNLFNDIKKDAIKSKPVNKNYGRPATVMNIKKNNNVINEYQKKNVDIGNRTNDDILNGKKSNRITSKKENKKVGNQDINTVNVRIYNPTIDSLGDYIQTINYKTNNNQKKAYTSNQNNKNYFLKQNTTSSKKSPFGKRKDETKTVENIFNNLNNYLPKVDINVDKSNYLDFKKKKIK